MTDKVLVAVPVYNEADKLPGLIQQFQAHPDYAVLFVDDGSTDDSFRLLQESGQNCLRHKTNLGVGAAIREAIDYARQHHYEFIVIMAGNGKMLPGEIPRLLKPLHEGSADYVQGSRYLPGGSFPNLPFGRRLATKALTKVTNLLLGRKGTDVTCGFRAYRLSLFDDPVFAIQQSWLNAYELEYYIHYHTIRGGYRVAEIPVSMVYPRTGKDYSKIRPFTGWWSILRPWILLNLGLKR